MILISKRTENIDMQEKILNHKENGLAMLFLIILLYAAGVGCVVLGASLSDDGGGVLAVLLIVIGVIWITVGWIPLFGLKILKPQEALYNLVCPVREI